MKFFGNGIVWDAEKNRPLCQFENGELETNDERTIEKLLGLGYESDGVIVENIEDTNDTAEEVDHNPEAGKMAEEAPEEVEETEAPEASEETKNTTSETPKKSKR